MICYDAENGEFVREALSHSGDDLDGEEGGEKGGEEGRGGGPVLMLNPVHISAGLTGGHGGAKDGVRKWRTSLESMGRFMDNLVWKESGGDLLGGGGGDGGGEQDGGGGGGFGGVGDVGGSGGSSDGGGGGGARGSLLAWVRCDQPYPVGAGTSQVTTVTRTQQIHVRGTANWAVLVSLDPLRRFAAPPPPYQRSRDVDNCGTRYVPFTGRKRERGKVIENENGTK